MKLVYKFLFGFFLISFLNAADTYTCSGTNHISNGSFENNLTSWNHLYISNAIVTAEVVSNESIDGNYSLKLINKTPYGAGKFGQILQTASGLNPNQKFVVSFWAKGK